ncbi:mitochondrial amidoxime-reducing component 1-like [Bradysia coprophila]|uniref:mitochondrial amidoxime-reducing component 1-like n=1 Tax=Bradysia coprophila TaxID=38358 RepID=UPI00187D7684|nr:mitochondrial amidoxime-reducing component 1-like [Bradysia coprophila]
MSSYPLWKIGFGCALTAAITYISIWWMKSNKKLGDNSRSTSELHTEKWLKVGKVKELFFYPLKSGRGKNVLECKFTEFGIAIMGSGQFTLRDRMFLVYNEENGKFVTAKNYSKLVLVNLYAEDQLNVRLQANGMQSIVFEPQNYKSPIADCSMWFDDPMKCIDCGDGPAEWISMFLTGKKSGLRLGFTTYQKRNLHQGPWEKFTKVYTTLSNDDTGLFADITSYMLMTQSSLNELNKKLDRPVTSLQFRPNIVVSGTEPFVEDKWEWIKIGEDVIIRNVKPCPRCAVIRVDPETANVDDEPLKCLRTLRAQKDPNKISVDGTAPVFGIYCGLYSNGNVAVGDDVFVYSE